MSRGARVSDRLGAVWNHAFPLSNAWAPTLLPCNVRFNMTHVLRPLFVILAVIALIFVVRTLMIPEDYGIHERGYMYGWYREKNPEEWKAFKVKYQGREYCKDCHAEQSKELLLSWHQAIECENCHGPAKEHPSDPPKLILDQSRELCIRCHSLLPYPTSERAGIKGIDPEAHNPGAECASCHGAHQPSIPE